MATSGKRKVDTGGTAPGSSGRVTPPKAKAKAAAASPTRYTPPTTGVKRGPSPRWVPVLMFGLWALGLALIILNYMQVLPGTEAASNGWYLIAGLAAVLSGIMVATQYR